MRWCCHPVWACLHIATLWTLGVAQPLFDLLGRQPEFFVAHRLRPAEAWLWLLGMALVVPLALAAPIGLLRGRWRTGYWLIALAALASLATLPLLNRLADLGHSTSGSVLAAALGLGCVFALMAAFSPLVRGFLSALSPALVVCPLLFLCHTNLFRPLGESPIALASVPSGFASDVPVVVVVFDEFPLISLLDADHHIDAGRYPHLAALAREATWCRHATTVHTGTVHAVPAILTGRFTNKRLQPTAADMPHNLFTLLGHSHAIHEYECVTRLCPRSLSATARSDDWSERFALFLSDLSVVEAHLLAPPQLARELPPISECWSGFTPKRHANFTKSRPMLVREFLAGIEPLEAGEKPPLHFLHLVLPHSPFAFLPSGNFYTLEHRPLSGLEGIKQRIWDADENKVLVGYQRHLLQTGYADRILGQIVARLKETGLYDRCLLVVVADHGNCIRADANYRDVSPECHADVMRVPLLVKRPHQTEGRIDDSNVQIIDVLPTVADVLGIDLPWPVDGVAIAQPRRPTHKTIFASSMARSEQTSRLTFDARLNDDWGNLPRKLATYGSGSWDQVYRIGPWIDWHGRPVECNASRDDLRVEWDDPDDWLNVAPETGWVPCYLEGLIRGRSAESRLELAVAVNGIVRGTCWTDWPNGDERRFRLMVPEESFRRGDNSVEVFVLQPGAAGLPNLARIDGVGRTQAIAERDVLIERNGREWIRTPDGRDIRIRHRAIQGQVDTVECLPTGLSLAGWAADVRHGVSAERVVVFVGTRSLPGQQTPLARPDLATAFHQAALHQAGFSLTIPRQSFASERQPRFRVIAIGRETASELTLSDTAYRELRRAHTLRPTPR